MCREHFTERLVPGRTHAAESNALVIFVEAQFALAIVEKRFASVGVDGAQIECQFPIRRARGARTATNMASHSARDGLSSPMSADAP